MSTTTAREGRGSCSPTTDPALPGRRPTHSYRQIAEALGIGVSTARDWVQEAFISGDEPLERLREQRKELVERRQRIAEARRVAGRTAELSRAEMARILDVSDRTVGRWIREGHLSPAATRAEIEGLAERRRQESAEKASPPVELSAHARRRAEAKAEAQARLQEQIDSGELRVRRITAKDLAILEAGRERRLPLSDREVAA